MTSLRRTLGLFSLTIYGVGIIVGAGLFHRRAVAGLSGDALWLSSALAAAVALVTGLSDAELATAFPRAGAEYVYLRNALPEHRWVAYAVADIVGELALFATANTVLVVLVASSRLVMAMARGSRSASRPG